MFFIKVSIYEPDGPMGMLHPILDHVFYGLTEEEANGYMRAHMRTDSFLCSCVSHQRFKSMRCVASMKKGQLPG